MRVDKKKEFLQKRCWRIRKKIKGTSERPRLSFKLTNQHLYAQCIDDSKGHTLVFVSSLGKEKERMLPNKAGSEQLGKLLGEKSKAFGIKQVVFDRNGRKYHGCVQAFAEAARAFLEF